MPVAHEFAIDLNADVGESLTDTPSVVDRELMRSITSASVAAGFHAGGPTVLRETVRLARTLNVAIGAHPSFPDREHFGRRDLFLPMTEVEDLVLYQVAAVAGVAAAEGVRLHHVKPHGALYNMAARDRTLALAVVRAGTRIRPIAAVVRADVQNLSRPVESTDWGSSWSVSPIGRMKQTVRSYRVRRPAR